MPPAHAHLPRVSNGAVPLWTPHNSAALGDVIGDLAQREAISQRLLARPTGEAAAKGKKGAHQSPVKGKGGLPATEDVLPRASKTGSVSDVLDAAVESLFRLEG